MVRPNQMEPGDVELSFTDEQLERQDWVDNCINGLLDELAGLKAPDTVLPWDMELIGLVRDACKNVIVDKLQLMTELEFYPYIEEKEV